MRVFVLATFFLMSMVSCTFVAKISSLEEVSKNTESTDLKQKSSITITVLPINIANVSAYQISGTCSEVDKFNIEIDGVFSEQLTCSQNSWTTSVKNMTSYAEGNHSFKFFSVNNQNLIKEQTILKDTIAPVAAITSVPPAVNNLSHVTVSALPSDTLFYFYKFGLAATVNCGIGSGYSAQLNQDTISTIDLSSLTDGAYRLCIYAVDAAGNSQSLSSATQHDWTKDTSVVTAVITPNFSAPTSSNSYSFTISAVSEYKSKVGLSSSTDCSNSSGYSASILTSSDITGTLAGGANTYKVCVVGKNNLGTWQSYASATSLSWVYDNVAPTISISSPANGVYANSSNQANFSVTVSCSENGRNVSFSAVSSVDSSSAAGVVVCNVGSASYSFDLSSVTQGGVVLTASQSDAAGNSSTSSAVSITKDSLVPSVGNPIDGNTNNSLTDSPTITWSAGTDNIGGSGVSKYLLSIGSSAGATDILTWTDIGNVTSYQRTGLSLTNGQTYYVNLRVQDAAGNLGVVQSSDGWLATSGAIETPKIYINDINATYTPLVAVNLYLFFPSQYSEMYITNTATCSSGGVWEPASNQKNNWNMNAALLGTNASVYVKFRTSGGVESACVSKSIFLATVNTYTMCTDTNAASDFGILKDSGGDGANYQDNENCDFDIQASANTTLEFTNFATEQGYDMITVWDSLKTNPFLFSDSGVGPFSSLTVNSGHIVINFNSDSSVNDTGYSFRWFPSSLSQTNIVTINNGDASTTSKTVSLSISFTDLAEMYITNTTGCAAGGTWETTAASKSWTLTNGNGDKNVYIKFRDSNGNQTPCYNDSILYLGDPPHVAFSGVPANGDGSDYAYIDVTDYDLSTYKFKFGWAASTDCTDSSGYSIEKNSGDTIVLNLTSYIEGNLKLCAVGKNSANVWQAYSDASSAIWFRNTPGFIEFTSSGRYIAEANQTLNLEVKATKVLSAGTQFKYEIYGELVPLLSLSGGTGTIPAGSDTGTISINLSTIVGAGTDKILWVSISQVNAPEQIGFQNKTTIIIQDSERAVTHKVMEISGNGNCAIFEPGTLHCLNGYTYVQKGANTDFKKIIVAHSHTCALDSNDYLWCFGWGFDGQLGLGNGNDQTNPTQIPTHQWKKVVGSKHWNNMCGIDYNDDLRCWGDQSYSAGANGSGTTSDTYTPTLIDSGYKFVDVALEYANGAQSQSTLGCAVTTTGIVRCWGANGYRYLNDGTTVDKLAPVSVDSGTQYSKIFLNYNHVCGITSLGYIKCWGKQWIGTGNLTPTIIDNTDTYKELVLNSKIGCGITSTDKIKCWGSTDPSYPTFLPADDVITPVEINPGQSYKKIVMTGTTYQSKICALRLDNTLDCAGYGLVNYTNNHKSFSPRVLTPWDSVKFTSISGYYENGYGGPICGVTVEKTAKCMDAKWNNIGVDSDMTLAFKPFYSTQTFSQISGQCGLTTANIGYCWAFSNAVDSSGASGVSLSTTPVQQFTTPFSVLESRRRALYLLDSSNKLYVLGIGRRGDGTSFQNYATPVAADAASSYTQITASYSNGDTFCGVTAAQKLRCWGLNTSGQLGVGNTTSNDTASNVDPSESYLKVVAAETLFCGLTTANKVKCWGTNTLGGIGDGSTQALTPVAVDSANNYIDIAAGGSSSYSNQSVCALRSDNRIYCWGAGTEGHLGTGNNTHQSLPTAILDGGKSFTKILMSEGSAVCALTTDNLTYCWGTPFTSTPALAFNGRLKNISTYHASIWIGSVSEIKTVMALDESNVYYRTNTFLGLPGPYYWSKYFELIQGLIDR